MPLLTAGTKFYTVREAAEKLNLAEYTVRKKIANHEIKAEKTSNRDGYRIAEDELINYLKKHNKNNIYATVLGSLFGGALGSIGGIMMPGALGLSTAAGLIAGGGVALEMSKMQNGTGDEEEKKELAKAKLNIGRLQDMIDAINLEIKALELEGGYDNLSVNDKKQVLQARSKVKMLKQKIKEIRLQYNLIEEDDSTHNNTLVEVPRQLLELRDSGELSEEEYGAIKERITRVFQDSEVVVPELVNDTLDPKYVNDFSEDSFWDKIKKVLKKAGVELIFKALQLYYATQSPNCPAGVKASIYAALGYFILPLDLIPDFIPVVGFSDDLMAIGAALTMAHMYIDDNVLQKARERMNELFGNSWL